MARRLALHNSACNGDFFEFEKCEREHPVGRFFGYCGDHFKQFQKCLKDQRKIQQLRNTRESRERYSKKNINPEPDQSEK